MSAPAPRRAATVVLTRPAAAGGLEVYLVRRHARSGFMGGAYVFPGGAVDPGEDDLRVTGARELEEECGVRVPPGDLLYFAQWTTPSLEPKRFAATFYVARLPEGQSPRFDDRETVDEVWVSPAEGLLRSAELKLPPPQIRTLHELANAGDWAAVEALSRVRAAAPHVILPRALPLERGFALLLPWDPEYDERGHGEAASMPSDHLLAVGPSRFVFDGTGWRHVGAGG